MPSFCLSHRKFYRYGGCPACIEANVLAQNYALVPQLTARWGQLTAQPDLINQDQFGVCGMTSAVYLLLQHDALKAQQLYEACFADVNPLFAGRHFTTAQNQQVRIRFRYLARGYRLMEDKQRAAVAAAVPAAHRVMVAMASGAVPVAADMAQLASPVNTTCLVDYCLSRGLGYVFKQTGGNRYRSEKVVFNMEFDNPQGVAPRDHRNITRIGNLALRTENLAFVMHDILGAQGVRIARKTGPAPAVPLAPAVAGVPVTNFASVAQLDQEFQAHFIGVPNAFALAAIYADIVDDGHKAVASAGNPANPNLTYNHWILITGFDRQAAGGVGGCPHGHVDLDIWTWARDYSVQICENHALSYIQDIVFGHF
jgi:hypothetical protein